uniref:A disintegrin and metalloproteinase with thrombospondin motifs 6 n=1 Tax=Phallusia mammillata TaxID=59560 RepID=A0A6F9D6H1_9ASCI|nr:A disintegrin and metalloproteinase with thrombospondin motifs 6 [Phallusia mammillata]
MALGRHRLVCATLAAFYFSFLADATTMERRHEKFVKTLEVLGAGGNFETVVTVTPTRVTRSGDFLEYASLSPLSIHEGAKKLRRRRSLDARDVREELDAASATAEGDHEVFFDLGDAPGTPLSGARLHLKRNYKLVSRNFLVEERSRGGKIVGRHSLVEDCHYKGVIHNHDSFSKVALSLCNGLQGVIVRDDDTFFIEPAWNHTTTNSSNGDTQSEGGHPHVILKRSVLEHLKERRENEDDLGHCGYSDKVAGETPWWKIDPREPTKKNEKQDEEDTSSQKHHHHRHANHRTSAGRSAAEEEEVDASEPDMEKSRRRRSVSVERHVEVMVVADKMMVGFHGRKDVEKYILTIMNIVSNLYHDSSIGNAVNIVVTRVVLLTEDQPGLEINHHADQSLNSFCRWQSDINVNESTGSSDFGLAHHDNAILITGYDICTYRNQPCGTLGLAPVSGMCEHMRSCSINEDIGLASAFTIAHEIGHNFGMNHDGTGNECGPGNGQPSKIMAPQMTTNTSPFMWSRCSKKYITDFLDSGAGNCLVDSPPSRDFNFPEEMPGQLHDADEQCRFQYGAQSKQCRYGDVCRELWCTSKNERCATNSIPAAEGTNCITTDIPRGWCYRGNCVPFGYRPQAVDGSWGSWTAWAECSRTCGTGISSSSRSCDNPAPEHGGKYCIGERMRYRSCNTQRCTDPNSEPRREQCARFDTELFRGKYYNWLPYTGSNVKACALNCLAQGFNFFAERAPAVIDGTKCFSDSLDVCINGECHHVGCDHVLHSNATEDKCRVCGGDGSTCETQAGIFNMPIRMHGQYHQVVTIPRGSVNILIQELEISKQNYIALKNSRNEDYINGGWTIDWPQKFKVAGTTFTYKRPGDEPESLEALGPTSEDLVVMLLVQEQNRGLRYEYNVPVERESSGDNVSPFLWSQGQWTPCTASCAGGTQRRPVECRRVDDDTVVQPSYCNQVTKPVEQEQSCNVEPCPPMWSPGEWSECSRTCGGGHRTRHVMCMRVLSQIEDEVIDDIYCTDGKPRSSSRCNLDTCPPQWTTGRWSSCKPRCGPGTKTRDVQCKSSDRRETFPDERCDIRAKPAAKAHCSSGACPPPRWVYGKWSKCSAQCGQGIKKRRVFCGTPGTNAVRTGCPDNRKPKTVQSCTSSCGAPEPEAQCIDDVKVGYCPLVLRFKFCNRAYFRKMCCSTCSRG